MRAYLAGLAGGVTLLMLSACGEAAGEGEGRASVMFSDNCAPCHGQAAQGESIHVGLAKGAMARAEAKAAAGSAPEPEANLLSVAAPAIAGLPDWYIERQLNKFRSGVRGAHGDDVGGLRMRPMSRTIRADDVQPLAVYISGLAPLPNEEPIEGDADAGKKHYAACGACHGADGSGNQALNAPPIGMLQSWYVESQLTKFRLGIRGSHPDDVEGQQMAPMAKIVPNDQAVTDLAAYVSTL